MAYAQKRGGAALQRDALRDHGDFGIDLAQREIGGGQVRRQHQAGIGQVGTGLLLAGCRSAHLAADAVKQVQLITHAGGAGAAGARGQAKGLGAHAY